ncbi:hypothetical protein GCM10010406_25520 [Streptomyces thermolineatus]|uniref:Integral membrane protein n=2 Tax=Streptomyces TaxID=1883 RepID=A0ABN3LPY6_9ACTN
MTDTADTAGTAADRTASPAGQSRPGKRFRPSCGVQRPAAVLLGVLLVGVAVARLGHRPGILPTSAVGEAPATPSWRMLAMFAGVLPLLSLHSPMADLEASATNRFHRGRALRLAGLWTASTVLFLGVSAVAVEGRVLEVMAVALPGWAGLGLVSGRLLGRRQAWALPALALCAISYWGVRAPDGTYPWWDFTLLPVAENPSGPAVSLALLGLGLFAHWLTPWRLRALSPRR